MAGTEIHFGHQQAASSMSMLSFHGCFISVRLWEVSVANRQSLIEPFVWLTSKMTQPPSKALNIYKKYSIPYKCHILLKWVDFAPLSCLHFFT